MRNVVAWRLLGLLGLAAVVACSASSGDEVKWAAGGNAGEAGGGTGDTAGSGDAPQGGGGNGAAGTYIPLDDSGSAGSQGTCHTGADEDYDKDGYSNNDGDCNDCDPNTNPGAFDDGSPSADGGAPVDSNCDGNPGGDTFECDDGLDIADNDAINAARAIGLCRVADPNATGKDKSWGVLSAKFVLADGNDGMNALSHGLLPKFGAANVQQGKTMLSLSSGTARAANQPDFQSPAGANMGTDCNPPIPNMESPSCPGVTTGEPHDGAALEVQIRVPTNTRSFKFNTNFYTYEYPEFICSEFNDFFVTLMDPKPSGSTDGNIAFDQDHNAISVNNSMLQVCNPNLESDKVFTCPLGTALLQGTGFDEDTSIWRGPHAATGWLQTQADITPGSIITLRFAIWDSGDHILDSTVLVDNFTFSVDPATGGTKTEPVPVPK